MPNYLKCPKGWSANDVDWHVPGKKKAIAYSTVATSKMIALLAQEHETIEDVRDAIVYDVEAKKVLDRYIALGYGGVIARRWFSYQYTMRRKADG